MKLALCVAVGLLAACGPDGKRVTVLHVEDETTGPVTPTVPGAEELSFAAADGVTIHGSYWAPDHATTACVVFAHQLSSTRAEYVPVIARLKGQAHLYAIDQRGHGASTTGPDGALTWKGFTDEDWQRLEVDLAGALDAVHGKGAGEACVVVGASIGSSAALRLAGVASARVTGVVLLSPGLNYRGLATPDAARATRAPVLIVHSQEQGAVDAATALANILRDAAPGVDVIADPGTAHGMKIVAGDPVILDRVVAFIAAHLGE